MKCKYTYCKHNGEVAKEEAIKIGSSYFHTDCYHEKQVKQEIEDYYLKNMPSCTLQILRKVIKQLIHEKDNPADYVLFVLRFIHTNNKTINNPFGLMNYCNDIRMKEAFKKDNITAQYKDIKKALTVESNLSEFKFDYKPNTKKWTDLI